MIPTPSPLVGATSPVALTVVGLRKAYGTKAALSDVSFEVPAGSIVGLLGPNGSGKSTTMKILLGILTADSGSVRFLGADLFADPIGAKRQIGYVPESSQLYEFLTGAEYLDFVAEMYGVERTVRKDRIGRYLRALELEGSEDSVISGYSQGMKQKISLIAALLHRPRLLILDEPLNALDPRAARLVKDLLRNLATADGVTVLFSTHVLEIAEAICDRIVILTHGRVRAMGTAASLREQSGLAGSGLEDVFLSLTGSGDLRDVAAALTR